MAFDKNKYEIVETGNWENPPPITLLNDVVGFLNMLNSVSDKKLLKWIIPKVIEHRNVRIRKGQYMGFFIHGKLFAHYMNDFVSIEDYLEANKLNIQTHNQFVLNQEAIKNNWPDYQTAKNVWKIIYNCRLTRNDQLEQKGIDLFKDIDAKQAKEPIYDKMPTFDETCQDKLD
ncbi:MAG: hypothetical protein ACTSO7_06565 [Candidatus Heimdallarchaeota archaeon]